MFLGAEKIGGKNEHTVAGLKTFLNKPETLKNNNCRFKIT